MILRASATGWPVAPLPRRGTDAGRDMGRSVKAPRVNDRELTLIPRRRPRYLRARCGGGSELQTTAMRRPVRSGVPVRPSALGSDCPDEHERTPLQASAMPDGKRAKRSRYAFKTGTPSLLAISSL